ncbi:MAG: putative phosphoribosyltransferase [Candidatus Levybacteria bacterium]|nr:putative phosphoribosyltransferase [Candidatus Levybacteria bacterium]
MFKDREEAGELLALKLKKIIKGQDFVVVALLRGGIVLGKKVADYFKIPLVPLSVKKIGAPSNPELAIGAITADKTFYFDENLIDRLGVDGKYLKEMSKAKAEEAKILQNKFPPLPRLRRASKVSLEDKKVIIVDDGVATGATAICASAYVRKHEAKEIILATPIIGKESRGTIKQYFNKIVALKIAQNLGAVGEFYEYFPQVSDEEAISLT